MRILSFCALVLAAMLLMPDMASARSVRYHDDHHRHGAHGHGKHHHAQRHHAKRYHAHRHHRQCGHHGYHNVRYHNPYKRYYTRGYHYVPSGIALNFNIR